MTVEQTDPQIDELLVRFYANHYLTGTGIETTIHRPCPFCGAPNYAVYRIMDTYEEEMGREHTCPECHRSGMILLTVDTTVEKTIELVQTGGPDLPDWYTPKPRRIDKECVESE